MHPLHRLPLEDWIQKICGAVKAADKFESEVIDLSSLLPQSWLALPLLKRQQWMKTIKQHGESWDTDLLMKLCEDDMPLCHVANIFRIFHLEKKIADPTVPTVIVMQGRAEKESFATPEIATAVHNTPEAPKKKRKKQTKMLFH